MGRTLDTAVSQVEVNFDTLFVVKDTSCPGDRFQSGEAGSVIKEK